MKRLYFAPLAALAAVVLFANPVPAAFHLWTFTEFFSNADGSVQFIELVSSGPLETVAANAEIRTASGNVFDFPSNLTGNTLNRRLLIATEGFGSIPGAVAPDFTLPTTNFFDSNGDTIRLFQPSFGEFHSRTFTTVPTDGIMSRNYPPAAGTLNTNSPTNYNGMSGSIDLSAPVTTGDYNGDGTVNAADYTVWRDALGQNVEPGTGADGEPDGTIDVADYNFWKQQFGTVVSGSAAAILVPEPSVFSLAFCGYLGVIAAARARSRGGMVR